MPPCHISSAYGDPLEAGILQDIATAFAALDTEFLEVLRIALKNAAEGRFSLDESSQRTLQQDRDLILGLEIQLGGIKTGKYRFHENYLRDSFMLTIWARASNVLSQMLDLDQDDQQNKPLLDGIKTVFRHLERSVEPLSDLLPAAVAQGVLEPDH